MEPHDVTVTRGHYVVIDCLAQGNPTPRISWKRKNSECKKVVKMQCLLSKPFDITIFLDYRCSFLANLKSNEFLAVAVRLFCYPSLFQSIVIQSKEERKSQESKND